MKTCIFYAKLFGAKQKITFARRLLTCRWQSFPKDFIQILVLYVYIYLVKEENERKRRSCMYTKRNWNRRENKEKGEVVEVMFAFCFRLCSARFERKINASMECFSFYLKKFFPLTLTVYKYIKLTKFPSYAEIERKRGRGWVPFFRPITFEATPNYV